VDGVANSATANAAAYIKPCFLSSLFFMGFLQIGRSAHERSAFGNRLIDRQWPDKEPAQEHDTPARRRSGRPVSRLSLDARLRGVQARRKIP
jgi:hypothetical protein